MQTEFSSTPRQLEFTKMIPKVDDKSDNKSRPRKLLDTGWTRIPDALKFSKRIGKLDPDWKALGIDKKLPTPTVIEPYCNKKMNRYMIYQIKRLETIKKIKSNNWELKYWKVIRNLLRFSKTFRVSAIHHTLPSWYNEYPYWLILRWNDKVSKIFNNWDDSLDFRRVYIPKGEDSFRPLGVPTVEWRIALHMFNNFLQMFTSDWLLESQHGFIPGKGTLTAWKEVMKKVVDAKYIYECDLKQFFPSVKLDAIMITLRQKLPWKEWFWLKGVNLNQPKLPQEQLLNEKRYVEEQLAQDIDAFMYQWFLDHPDTPEELQADYDRITNKDTPHTILDASGPKWHDKEDQCIAAVKEKFGKTPAEFRAEWKRPEGQPNGEGFMTGVPQGAPTSPLTSILTLKKFLTQQPSISYADDPIFYNNEEFEIRDEPENGIRINEEKSRWIRWDGKWSESLKYLGLKYNPLNNSLYGNTRKGSKLKFTPEFRDKILKKFAPAKPKSWVSLFELPDAGMLFSRLYIGSWSSEDLKQDFRLKFKSKSLTWLLEKGHRNPLASFHEIHNIFNISSIASQLLCKRLTLNKRKGIRKPRYYYLRKDQETKLRDTSNPRLSFMKLLYK